MVTCDFFFFSNFLKENYRVQYSFWEKKGNPTMNFSRLLRIIVSEKVTAALFLGNTLILDKRDKNGSSRLEKPASGNESFQPLPLPPFQCPRLYTP